MKKGKDEWRKGRMNEEREELMKNGKKEGWMKNEEREVIKNKCHNITSGCFLKHVESLTFDWTLFWLHFIYLYKHWEQKSMLEKKYKKRVARE